MAVSTVLVRKCLVGMWALCLLLIMWLSVSVEGVGLIQRRLVKCKSPLFPSCFLVWRLCPVECPRSCLMDCAICRPVCSCNLPGAVCQDPRFVGGDGLTFYFHGRKDEDFCLVSDKNLHINGHFIGKRNTNMKRDFTWVQSIGILFDSHRLLVAAKKTSIWDSKVDRLDLSFDGNPISLPTNEGTKWQSSTAPHVSVTRTQDTNGVTVEAAGNFKVTAMVVPITAEESRVHSYNITDENCFAHLELGFKFYKLTDEVEGVLGQTYRTNYVSKAKMGAPMPVLGGHHKFSTSHIFATDCAVSRFGKSGTVAENSGAEYASLQCNSGMEGQGVVCKR